MGTNKILKNTFWNSAGVLTYFACQWLITIIIVWLSEDHVNVGNLALAMNVTNFFCTIALYNVRVFQVSDIHEEYNDSEYVAARILTCLGSILLCAGFVFIINFTAMQRIIILCYMIFRANEAFIDVLHGIDQKKWRMDYIGISLIIRGISMLIIFAVLTRSSGLLPAIIGMAGITILIGIIFDIPKTKKLAQYTTYNLKKIISLLKKCFPLMLVILSGMTIVTFSRLSIERIYGEEALGIYAAVTAPTMIIQVAIAALFAPLSNIFAECLKTGKKSKFIRIFIGFSGVIIISTFIFYILSDYLGKWGLNLLYNDPIIVSHAYLLPGACIAVGCSAAMWFMNLVFVATRDIKGIFICNMIGVVICIAAANIFLVNFGTEGANHIMILSQGIAIFCLIIRLFRYLKIKPELFCINDR